MSRTYAGFLFKCRECGKTHLLDGEIRNGILIPCKENKHAKHIYKESDFIYWHGYYSDVCDIIVKEAVNS